MRGLICFPDRDSELQNDDLVDDVRGLHSPDHGDGRRDLQPPSSRQLRHGGEGAAAAPTPSRKLRRGEVGAAATARVQAPPRRGWS
jgi:hypothetical protein